MFLLYVLFIRSVAFTFILFFVFVSGINIDVYKANRGTEKKKYGKWDAIELLWVNRGAADYRDYEFEHVFPFNKFPCYVCVQNQMATMTVALDSSIKMFAAKSKYNSIL